MSASSSSDEETALGQDDLDAISEAVERMSVSKPNLASLTLSIVVQFYDAENAFWCETSELNVPQEFVERCAADALEYPVRLLQTFSHNNKSGTTPIPGAPHRGQSKESFGESPGDLPVYDADECASAVVPTPPPPMIDNQALWDLFDNCGTSSEEEEDSSSDSELPSLPLLPRASDHDVIPRKGTCMVLAVLGAGCPVLVGLVSERYNLDRPYSAEELADDGVAHVKLQGNKRVYWRGADDEADAVLVKRRRAGGEDGAAAESVAIPSPLPAAPSADADADAAATILDTASWTSQLRTGQSRCWWWLDETTGRLDSLKIELALHSAFLRDTLNMALEHFTL